MANVSAAKLRSAIGTVRESAFLLVLHFCIFFFSLEVEVSFLGALAFFFKAGFYSNFFNSRTDKGLLLSVKGNSKAT